MAGDYTGVGFLSSAPTRVAAQRWHLDVAAIARFSVGNAFLDPFWLLARVCYGYASGPPCKTHSLSCSRFGLALWGLRWSPRVKTTALIYVSPEFVPFVQEVWLEVD